MRTTDGFQARDALDVEASSIGCVGSLFSVKCYYLSDKVGENTIRREHILVSGILHHS